MKFTKDALVNGTSLVGYVTASYSELVEKFGLLTSGLMIEAATR